ncbi:MAG TPA: tetratricopeptide repeat protein [Thermoleophilia bacterium]|nr:tetratricopeptide repeat protein [Thermoleophilia bacterium]
MLLDRRKVKFWQKIVFGFMAFLMAAFLIVGYSGVLNGCTFFNSTKSATDQIQQTITTLKNSVAASPADAAMWIKLGDNYGYLANQQTAGSSAEAGYQRQATAAYKKADAILAKQKGKAAKDQRLSMLQQLASEYVNLKDYQAATAVYGEITSLKPKDAQSYSEMALVAISAGDTNTALLAFSKYLELNPNAPDAAQVKAWIKQNTPKSTSTPSPSPTK